MWVFSQIEDNDFSLQPVHVVYSDDLILRNHPKSVYTTFRTYHRLENSPKYFRLDDHFQRIKESCELQNFQFILAVTLVKKALAEVSRLTPISGELRIKLIYDPTQPGNLLITAEKLSIPDSESYANGVKVISKYLVRKNPLAKTFIFTTYQHSFEKETTGKVNEVLLLDSMGEILEGSSSNFFAFVGDSLMTAGSGMLKGITRQLVLDLAVANGFIVQYEPVKIDQLGSIEECFITSTSRGILPVVQIDQISIGNGVPGKRTGKLMRAYVEAVEKELLPL